MKKSRIEKMKKTQTDNAHQPTITREDMDRLLFDLILSELYENSDINAISYDEILKKHQVEIPDKEKERIWDILVNSMWVSPVVGFGQSGKLELTSQGYQLMTQFGSYSNYLASMQVNAVQAKAQIDTPHDQKGNPPPAAESSAAKKKDK